MLTHRGFSAWIVSEGDLLREYLVAVDADAHRVSCWIPCEAGKSFSVHWKDEGSNVHSCSFISLDGFVVPGRFLFGNGQASRDGIRTGPITERPFIFADQHNTVSGGQPNRDAGTILLKIKRVSLLGQKLANKLQQLPEPSAPQSSMVGHCIRYGEERPTYEQSSSTWQVKPYDESSKRSYVTFVFRYRSREFLLCQGIMTESDGTAQQVPPAVKKARPAKPKRRVASAPLPEIDPKLITPSPTPSPNSSQKKERMSSSLQNAFTPGSVRTRPAANVRTVSMKAPGRHEHYPGESILELYPTTEPDMFRMYPGVGAESQKTLVGEEQI